jgi:hypothetical protein
VLEVEELVGDWERIRELEARIESAVTANRATPCLRNGRSLLVCAAAAELLGDHARSRAFEAEADELHASGFGVTFGGPRLRLAMARQDVGTIEELLADRDWYSRQNWFLLPGAAARLDALAVVGNEEALEAESLPARSGYLEPFRLRALGLIRADELLVAAADERFRALDLDWHAAQTETLARFRNSAAG